MENITILEIEQSYKKKYEDYKELHRKCHESKLAGDTKNYEHYSDLCFIWGYRLSGMRYMIRTLGYSVIRDEHGNISLEKLSV